MLKLVVIFYLNTHTHLKTSKVNLKETQIDTIDTHTQSQLTSLHLVLKGQFTQMTQKHIFPLNPIGI